MFSNIIRSRFQRGSAARDVAVLALGTVIAQMVAMAATPLLSRLYSPSEFGLLAVFLVVASVGATFVTLRYESSILVPKENAESASLVLLSLFLVGGFSLTLAVLSALIPVEVQEIIGLGALGAWVPIAFLTAAATAVFVVMQGWMNRQKKYMQIAGLRVGQSIALAGLAIALGVLNIENGLLIAQACISVCLCFAALWLGRSVALLWKTSHVKAVAVVHKNAPRYMLPAALLDVVSLQMPVVLIAAWFGVGEAGQFSMAWRLLMLPMALVGGAIGQVFMQRFSSLVTSPLLAGDLIKRSWLILFLIGFLPFLSIFLFGDLVFYVFLGDEWSGSGEVAKVLAPMALAMFVSSPTSGAFIILGIQKYSLLFGVTSLIYRPFSLFLGYYFGDVYLGLMLWVVFEILQIFLYQVVAWVHLKKVRL